MAIFSFPDLRNWEIKVEEEKETSLFTSNCCLLGQIDTIKQRTEKKQKHTISIINFFEKNKRMKVFFWSVIKIAYLLNRQSFSYKNM